MTDPTKPTGTPFLLADRYEAADWSDYLRVEVPSDTTDESYTVIVTEEFSVCSCKGSRYRQTCKHIHTVADALDTDDTKITEILSEIPDPADSFELVSSYPVLTPLTARKAVDAYFESRAELQQELDK